MSGNVRERQSIGPLQVDVWEVSLDDPGLTDRAAVLTAEERERAERFHQAVHRRRFLARRVVLRLRLAEYLDREPSRIELAFGPKGKPYLPGGELELNLSHSFDRALIGFSRQPLGVDIEGNPGRGRDAGRPAPPAQIRT